MHVVRDGNESRRQNGTIERVKSGSKNKWSEESDIECAPVASAAHPVNGWTQRRAHWPEVWPKDISLTQSFFLLGHAAEIVVQNAVDGSH